MKKLYTSVIILFLRINILDQLCYKIKKYFLGLNSVRDFIMIKQLKISVLFSVFFFFPILTFSQTPPPLGVSGDFTIFTSVGAISNVGLSQITGNVGTNGGGSSAGFGNINGNMHIGDATSLQCALDVAIAYTNLSGQIPGATIGLVLGAGQILPPNIYLLPGATSLLDTLTLDGGGDSNACFVFQINGALSSADGGAVILINGAKACNVFWRVDGAISTGVNTFFKGTFIGAGAIDFSDGVNLEGRAFTVTGAFTVTSITAGIPLGCGNAALIGPVAPILEAISCFSIYTSLGTITNIGTTSVVGDIGTNSGSVLGFDPLLVTGVIHSFSDPSTILTKSFLDTLYSYLNGLPYDIELLYPALFGYNQVLTPNVYLMNAAATITDTIFLDARGVAGAVFVIRINGALTTGFSPQVVLIGGTEPNNVFWLVEGAVSISSGSNFNGIIVSNNGAITLNTGVILNGKILSTNGDIVTSDVNIITPICFYPLPIELLSFTVVKNDTSIEINWTTSSENNNDYFNIERSADGINFNSIIKVNGGGSSSQALNYSIFDDQPLLGTSYYRLKQTDYDGETYYSNIEVVEFNLKNNFIFNNYPNPFSDETTFRTNKNLKNSRLIVYNSYGQVVQQIKDLSGQTFTFKRENLASGSYYINLLQNDKIIATNRLVIID
jgi:hypothetical protein